MKARSLARVVIAVACWPTPTSGTAGRKSAHKTAPKPPSVADIATQWGLVGSWAVDCATPAAIGQRLSAASCAVAKTRSWNAISAVERI